METPSFSADGDRELGDTWSTDTASGVAALSLDNPASSAESCPATTVLYLNFDGARLVGAARDNAQTGASSSLMTGRGAGAVVDFPAAKANATIRAQIHAFVANWYRPFNIRVVTDRPTSGPYTMILIGGSMSLLGEFSERFEGTLGMASVDCGDENKGTVGFIWEDVALEVSAKKSSANRQRHLILMMAAAAAHEAGHSFGLNHVDSPSGTGRFEIMMAKQPSFETIQYDANRIGFFDEQIPSNQSSTLCQTVSQNSVEVLGSTLGRAGCVPPQAENPIPPVMPPPEINPGANTTGGQNADEAMLGEGHDEGDEVAAANGANVVGGCAVAPGRRSTFSPTMGLMGLLVLAAMAIFGRGYCACAIARAWRVGR